MKRIPIVAALIAAAFCARAEAESFKILGARALGMGGAFVAVAEDTLAQHWNPAGIAKQKNFDVEIPAHARVEFTNQVLKDINTIADFADTYKNIQDAQEKGTSVNVKEMSSIVQTAETLEGLSQPEKAALVEAHGGFNLRIMRLALSVNNFTSVGATPVIDTTNIGLGASGADAGVSFSGADASAPSDAALLAARNDAQAAIDTLGYDNIVDLVGSAGLAAGGIDNSEELANALVNGASAQGLSNAEIADAAAKMKESAPAAKTVVKNAASGNSYSGNTSNAVLRGISLTEVALGYGHTLFHKDLFWGANLKALVGRVGYYRHEFLEESASANSAIDDFVKNSKQTIQPGVDLGLLLDKRLKWRTKLGVVAKNVNNPEFDQPAEGAAAGERKYRVQPQVRAGIALYPLKRTFWVLASDVDLTSNNTPVPGLSSRVLSVGTEVNLVNTNLFNLGLRAGALSNLADKRAKPAYTAGLELKFLHFFVSLAGALSAETEEIKSGESSSQKVPTHTHLGISMGLDW